jgi:hypothetical protein
MEVAKINVAPPPKEDYQNVCRHTMVENKTKLYTIFTDNWR